MQKQFLLFVTCLFHFTRSRDVAELRANMTFDPAKINLQQAQYQCEHSGRKSVCVKTDVCFFYTVKSDKQDSSPAAGEVLLNVCDSEVICFLPPYCQRCFSLSFFVCCLLQ